jgi:hypothetical protein
MLLVAAIGTMLADLSHAFAPRGAAALP